MPSRAPIRVLAPLATALVLLAAATAVDAARHSTGFTSRLFADGTKLTHATAKGPAALADPDDITSLRGHIFVGFQNGVGPQGEASTTGNLDSTVVEFAIAGKAVAQWDVKGKCDGLSADPALGAVIATVNEDAHSSFYLIHPTAGAKPVHYHYSRALPSHGGTDAIDVYRGMLLFSASAPGTTGKAAPQASYPAVYRVVLEPKRRIGVIHGLFSDEATARALNAGKAGTVRLGLTDPDSNETVPSYAPRFAGDFMLTSQGDKEQIFVSGAMTAHRRLSVLKLSDSVDDTVWASGPNGTIYTTDNGTGRIYAVTGPFRRGQEYVADTPCDANGAPSTCPAKGYPANFIGRLNPRTGAIAKVAVHGAAPQAQGMLFLP